MLVANQIDLPLRIRQISTLLASMMMSALVASMMWATWRRQGADDWGAANRADVRDERWGSNGAGVGSGTWSSGWRKGELMGLEQMDLR